MITVQTSHDSCEVFKKRKIIESLMKETGIKESEAMKIARSVERDIKKNLKGETITTAQVRVMAQERLLKKGMMKEARDYERLGIPRADIKKIISEHNNSNANIGRNPEAVHKYVADSTMKPYALLSLPNDLAKAHDSGDLHCHDLEFFAARPINCLQHDLRTFIREGLRVDGTGDHTSAAGPAKNIETLVNHAGQVMMASQVNMSGGQSIPLFNVFMAPYVDGLSYERIKQAMQMFIFNLNMSYVSRGGQTVFSTVNLEFDVPKFLENETAWGPGGARTGVYGDYSDETKLLQKAFTEVLLEGDSMGKPHLFPNTVYMLRDESFDDEYISDLERVHELSAKYSTAYFGNCIPKWTGGHSDVMGCRTRLDTTWTGDWDKDTLRTGNLAYITINLPRIAYQSADINEFLAILSEKMELAEQILLIRREQALKCMGSYKLLPFLTQKDSNGNMYYRIENATLSFGFVGMHEALLGLGIEDGIMGTEGPTYAGVILEHMNAHAKDLTEETGHRWSVIATPAESTAHRFAELDVRDFGDKAIVKGDKGCHYYTNSNHVPVDADVGVIDRVKIEQNYHPLTKGGHIFNAFLGEEASDTRGLSILTKKIATKTDIGFWAYSGAFSHCFKCNTYMRGLKDQCVNCGSIDDVEWYDRITGYVQAVGHKKDASGGWNAGKKQELIDRKRLSL